MVTFEKVLDYCKNHIENQFNTYYKIVTDGLDYETEISSINYFKDIIGYYVDESKKLIWICICTDEWPKNYEESRSNSAISLLLNFNDNIYWYSSYYIKNCDYVGKPDDADYYEYMNDWNDECDMNKSFEDAESAVKWFNLIAYKEAKINIPI